MPWDTSSTHPQILLPVAQSMGTAGMGCPSAKGKSSEMLAGETGEHGRKGNTPQAWKSSPS